MRATAITLEMLVTGVMLVLVDVMICLVVFALSVFADSSTDRFGRRGAAGS
jgi:hypothetical protein